MANRKLSPRLLGHIADRFKTLADPSRLQILHELRDGEKAVSELVDLTGLGQANISKHLQLLHSAGFVARRKDGLFVYYSIADEDVFRLCDIVCGRLADGASQLQDLLAATPRKRAAASRRRAH